MEKIEVRDLVFIYKLIFSGSKDEKIGAKT